MKDAAMGAAFTTNLISSPLPDRIDHATFTPRLLALLSNALVSRESKELRRRFGLGTNEWRVLSALASWPGASASEVCDILSVNKAIVSKSVNTLVAQRLVELTDGPRGSRPLYLTEPGAMMHDQMLPISTAGQDLILAGMTEDEISQLNDTLVLMLGKLHRADEEDAASRPQN